MKSESITPRFVEFIPSTLVEGTLYISSRYRTAVHKCCCGCEVKIVTPITPTDWSLTVRDAAVTLNPSIGNWNHPCQSHYFIRANQVVWAGKMSKRNINHGRELDRARKDAYFGKKTARRWSNWWQPLVRWITSLFG